MRKNMFMLSISGDREEGEMLYLWEMEVLSNEKSKKGVCERKKFGKCYSRMLFGLFSARSKTIYELLKLLYFLFNFNYSFIKKLYS